MSRVLPDAIVSRVQKQLRIADTEHLREELPKMIEEGLQRLYDQQNTDGGIGWWKGDASNPNMTAYILFGLNEVKKAGFAVDEGMMARGITFVTRWLEETPIDAQPTHAYSHIATGYNVRAYALYVLAELGEAEPYRGMAINLYDRRGKLDHYGKGFLALTLYILDDNQADGRVNTLLDELRRDAVIAGGMAHWEEEAVDHWMMNTDARTTAIVLDAFVRIAPEDALVPQAVRWLMHSRRNGHWGSTQATAMSLIAMVDYLLVSGELDADYTYRVLVDGVEVGGGVVDESNLAVPGQIVVPLTELPEKAEHEVEVVRFADTPALSGAEGGQSGEGSLYATVSLRHYKPTEEVKATSQGITVRRRFSLREGGAVGQVAIGDVVEVKLTVRLDDDVNYLVVEDPLPAGLEPIDTSLDITAQEYRLDNDDWTWTYVELHDDRVALFATYLEAGTYTYHYLARATTPGDFQVLPSQAYPMYYPDVYGRGGGIRFTVEDEG
jgi:uncharacterized protein YfaS (alpha-2-macroglobulin family)